MFQLHSNWQPRGDQPKTIEQLVENFHSGKKRQTLLGVTGSGKTFVIANVIQKMGLPTLIISHNKTLAAQLYSEFRSFFPENAVEYFISYYDYYQPEAYVANRDFYIEKESSINEQIDRLRMAATSSLLGRRDVIIVASVSCIYNVGDPEDYKNMVLSLEVGQEYERAKLLYDLTELQYRRDDRNFSRGNFRSRGDVIEIWPSYLQLGLRVELLGDTIERVSWTDVDTGATLQSVPKAMIYPAKHYVIASNKIATAMEKIKEELEERVTELQKEGKMIEADRLNTRTRYDMEILQETGFCTGIENYSRHFSNRKKGDRPYCLIDYFPKEFLTIVDESHVTIPQIRGMYRGDVMRKKSLIDYGFRLPSALDNRPNTIEEWESITDKIVYVSATPAEYEFEHSEVKQVELLVRPTGLVDPLVEIRPTQNQVEDLITLITQRKEKKERVLAATLTKDMAMHLAEYLQSRGIKANYLHHKIQTLERIEILQGLRRGDYDVIVGINLLREGLDLPEVSLVAILDADRQGFLRTQTSLIQTMGRAARNVNSLVILYADNQNTPAIQGAVQETNRRRAIQIAYNLEHNITPQSIQKEITDGIANILRDTNRVGEWDGTSLQMYTEDNEDNVLAKENKSGYHSLSVPAILQAKGLEERILTLETEMKKAAMELNFEYATLLRDQIFRLRGQPIPESPKLGNKRSRRRR